jgi:membrane protease YdiL (CAAX protease family)
VKQYKSKISRILHVPISRIILGLAFCIAINIVLQNMITIALEYTAFSHALKNIIKGFFVSLFFIAGYIRFYSLYENKPVTLFSTKGVGKNLIQGLLLGSLLQCLTIYILYLNNGYHIISVNTWTNILPLVFSGLAIAIIEETLLRGIIFRIAEEKLGTYLSLALSSLIFGALHLVNPHSTLATAFAIAVEGGLLLGSAFVYRRNLWFPIAIHFAWNFTQTGIFGAVTSGNLLHESLLTSSLSGKTLVSGGAFGPEASIQAFLFCLIASILLLILSHRQNKIVEPYWSKQKQNLNILIPVVH